MLRAGSLSPAELLDPRVPVLADLALEAVDPAFERSVRFDPPVESSQKPAAPAFGHPVGQPTDLAASPTARSP